MQKQVNNPSDILETMFHEFNDHDFYGLEFIMDELYEIIELNQSRTSTSTNTDWFGFKDSCVSLD